MKRRNQIAVIGDANLIGRKKMGILAERLGKALVDNGYRIITGGLGGIMEAVWFGAKKSSNYQDGDIISILPGYDPSDASNPTDICIATGLDEGRNVIIGNSDAIIAIGGGAGTLSEIAFAWMAKRLIIAYRVKGWSGRLADTRLDERIRVKGFGNDRIFGVDSEQEALTILKKYLSKYGTRTQGISWKGRV